MSEEKEGQNSGEDKSEEEFFSTAEMNTKLNNLREDAKEYYEKAGEKLKEDLLGITETFYFDNEDVESVRTTMTRGFIRGWCKEFNLPEEKKKGMIDIIIRDISGRKSAKETGEKQEILEKAFNVLIKEKERFIKELNELKAKPDDKIKDVLYFADTVSEIFDVLGEKEQVKEISIVNIAYYIKEIQKSLDIMTQLLEVVENSDFIENYDVFTEKVRKIEDEWPKFLAFAKSVNWTAEIQHIFSFFGYNNEIEKHPTAEEKLKQLIKHFGFELVCPKKGDEYNPKNNEAEGEEPSDVKRGQVVKVSRMGLKKGDEVVQKARVIIGK